MAYPNFWPISVFLGELIAPLLLIIGYRTRLASLFIAATMVVAILLAHSNEIFKLGNHGNWALEINGLIPVWFASQFYYWAEVN